ncbi:MAG TPA: glycoside hydrolase family 31 protein, partial [Arachnia sp.]|nr:glycoside hydrolase family 31 protein [Arachnia sp.]
MAFEVLGNGVLWRGDGETVRIEAWGRGIRVRAAVMAEIRDADFALLDDVPTAGVVRVDGNAATITAGGTTVVAEEEVAYHWSAGFHRDRLRLRFQDADGRVVLEEIGDGGALMLRAREYRPSAFGGAALRARFASDPDEHIAGMGLYQQPFVDLKGTTLELAHRNSQTSVPFLQSSSGYGFLWNNPATGAATFGRNYTEWTSEAADQLDYWVTVGATPREISDAYAGVTGRPPMMPEHGLGFWQCKLRYWNQEQLLEVAREHHRRGIPLDVIVADFFHWQWMGDYSFEEEFWPDPGAMVRELKELGVELMVSVWPQVSPNSDNFLPLQKENLLVKTRTG